MYSVKKESNSKPDWSSIFSLDEFIKYLTIQEQLQISTLSKYLNRKLKPYTFSHLNLTKYIPYNHEGLIVNSNTTYSEIVNNQIEKLTLDLKPYRPYVVSLTIGKYFNHALILAIPTIIPNLTTLELSIVSIPLESLNELFHHLSALRTLTLSNFMVITWLNHSESNINLKFPITLKHFTYNNCRLVKTQYISNPFELYRDYSELPLGISECFQFPSKSVTNLKSLARLDKHYPSAQIEHELLNCNRQITSYETNLIFLNYQGYNLLSKCNQLTTLRINDGFSFDNFADFNSPQLETIKALELNSMRNYQIPLIQNLYFFFPNITNLTLYYDHYLFKSSLGNIVTNLAYLDILTIHNDTIRQDFKFEFPSCGLKNIVINGFHPVMIPFSRFKLCTELKRVTVGIQLNYMDHWPLFEPHYEAIHGWTSFVYDQIIQCYKD